jgi:NAD(P)-dependent dehydrogenase (short-subunit alcohol dehydrogenase family)
MAGLLTPPNMGIYNVSKHAVVSLTETLYQDLKLVSDQVSASVLCPYFVPTGISQSHRNRPADLASRSETHAKPAHRPGHERQGGGLRQGDRGRRGAKGVRRHRRTSSTSSATPRRWAT